MQAQMQKKIQAVLLLTGMCFTGCISDSGSKTAESMLKEQKILEPAKSEPTDSEGIGTEIEPIELEVYAWQDEEDNLTALAQAYMEQNKEVSIHTNFVPISEYPQQMMSLRNGSRQVDCCFFPSVAEANIWQNKGMLKNLKELLFDEEQNETYASWYQQGEETYRFYMLPYRMSRWAVYYNKDLFDRRGVAYPKEDWTWEDYEKIAVQLTKQTGQDKSYGSLSFEPTSTWWRIPARTKGANDPFLAEDLAAFQEAAEWCYHLTYELGAQLPYTEQIGKAGSSYDANFLEGNVGMYFSGDWSVASLNKMIKQNNLDIHYDIATMPHWEGEESWVISDAAVAAVSEMTQYEQEAWAFLQFVTGEEGAAVLADRGIIPAYESDAIQKRYLDSSDAPEHREYFFTEGKISAVPASGSYVEAMEMIKEEVAHYLLQEQRLEQTFDAISEKLDELRGQ